MITQNSDYCKYCCDPDPDKRTFIPGIFFFKGCRSCAIDRLSDSFIRRFPTFCCSIRCRRSLDLAALSLRTTCAGRPCRWPLNLTSLSLRFICAGRPCRRSLSFAILSLRVACIVRPCRRSLSFAILSLIAACIVRSCYFPLSLAGCGILRIGCVSLIHCRSLFLRAPCDSGLRQLRIL